MSASALQKERRKFEAQFQPLYDCFHRKKSGFKEKEAIFYNNNKITIFRGDDLLNFILENKDLIVKVFPKDVKEIQIDDEKDSQQVAKILLDNKIIMRLERHPEDPVKRWPKRLIMTKDQRLSGDSFYTWNLQTRSGFSNLKMTLILVGLFMVFLYPIWPFAFKFAVFKISLYLLVGLLIFTIGRLVVYLIARTAGWIFWIFPNMEDDSLGFWASFKPAYSIERANDGKIEILLRFIGFLALLGLVWAASQEPQMVADLSEAGGQTMDDILDWGKSKLEGKQEPIHSRAIPDLSQILKEEEEERLKQSRKGSENPSPNVESEDPLNTGSTDDDYNEPGPDAGPNTPEDERQDREL